MDLTVGPSSLTPVSHDGGSLTPSQMAILIILERTGAGLSMGAIALTVLTYIVFPKLRTTPNLFLLCASGANAAACCASMIGYDGMHAGLESGLCQAQAFIFQWFMQADPWWSFAMAVNVYLVFFFNANPTSFRKYLWIYCLVCFGGPLISAIALISVRGDPRGPIFGDAVCWIDTKWALVRIYSYYIPVWVCIFLSLFIYVAVGYHVFHHRNQFRNIGLNDSSESGKMDLVSSSDGGESAEHYTARFPDFYGTAVTEVKVTSDTSAVPNLACNDFLTVTLPPAAYRHNPSRNRSRSWAKAHTERYVPGSGSQNFQTICSSDNQTQQASRVMSRLRGFSSSASLKLRRLDPVKMAYLRTSFIFGFAIFVTWTPSSINRLYSITNDNKVSFHLSVASGCVLPLQGVWNAIIYFATSWSIVKVELKALASKIRRRQGNDRTTMRPDGGLYTPQRRLTFENTQGIDRIYGPPLGHGSDEIELCEQSQFTDHLEGRDA
ncbi:hypothetical protein NLU13_0965 [Sarocladium strictum]|uniref:G-protein coupled receptors family 2 profile 2 domain-containing protein n=1 Tax=Sarocladium strictum TaxID=5046 RepID=A0AA39GRZ7_SARSR|nr:hypothetical protein NLU13_0965 [Sarocladium strictum]